MFAVKFIPHAIYNKAALTGRDTFSPPLLSCNLTFGIDTMHINGPLDKGSNDRQPILFHFKKGKNVQT